MKLFHVLKFVTSAEEGGYGKAKIIVCKEFCLLI